MFSVSWVGVPLLVSAPTPDMDSYQLTLTQLQSQLEEMQRSMEKVLDWICAQYENKLPEELLQYIHPSFHDKYEIKLKVRDSDPDPVLTKIDVDSDGVEDVFVHTPSPSPSSPGWSPGQAESDSDSASSFKIVDLQTILSQNKKSKCPYCNLEFESKIELSQHSITHCRVILERVPDSITIPARKRKSFVSWLRFTRVSSSSNVFKSCKIYQCPTCEDKIEFSSVGRYERHRQVYHVPPKSFPCEICKKTFKAKAFLRFHIENLHPADLTLNKCSDCGKEYPTKRGLRDHRGRMHGPKTHKCNYCDVSFKTRSQLALHEALHLGKNLAQCPHCGILKSRNNMKNHIEGVHEGKRYKCNLCDQIVRHPNGVKSHYLLKHPDHTIVGRSILGFATIVRIDPASYNHKTGGHPKTKSKGNNKEKSLSKATQENGETGGNHAENLGPIPIPTTQAQAPSVEAQAGAEMSTFPKNTDELKKPAKAKRKRKKISTPASLQNKVKQKQNWECSICNKKHQSRAEFEIHQLIHKQNPLYRYKPLSRPVLRIGDRETNANMGAIGDEAVEIPDPDRPEPLPNSLSESSPAPALPPKELPVTFLLSTETSVSVSPETINSVSGSTPVSESRVSGTSSHCPYDGCECSFQNDFEFRQHLSTAHPPTSLQKKQKPKLKCPKCDKFLAHRRSLKRHIRYVHSEVRAFHCSICNISIKTERDLRRHEAGVVHKRVEQEMKLRSGA